MPQHFQSQWQSCGPEVDGPLEALDTPDGKSQHWIPGSRALVPQGVVQEGDCCHKYLYGPGVLGLAEVGCKECDSFFGAWDWDQLEGVAETLVVPDTGGIGGSGRWGQGSGQ